MGFQGAQDRTRVWGNGRVGYHIGVTRILWQLLGMGLEVELSRFGLYWIVHVATQSGKLKYIGPVSMTMKKGKVEVG